MASRATERPKEWRCAVCGRAEGCAGTVCSRSAHDAVGALLAELELRTGVSIEAEAAAEIQALVVAPEAVPGAAAIATVAEIGEWFSAGGARGVYEARSRPSCPHCGGWLYVDVDIDEVELHAAGTREIVCINCARRWYVWVGKQG